MLRSVQPQFSFKSIEGTYSRDPLRLGQPCHISADGFYIFSISDAEESHEKVPLASATVHTKTGAPVSSIKSPSLVNCGGLSGDGTIALAGTNSGCFDLWNARTGHSLAHKEGNGKAVCDLSLSPQADLFASTSFHDASVFFWDSTYLRIIHDFPKILEQPPRGGFVSIQGNGRRIFACDFKKIHVLDCAMQREAYSIQVSDMGVNGSFINDCSCDRYGRTVAAFHWPPNQLCLWDMRMRKIRSKIRLKGNQGFGTVSMTPDGGRVVVSTYSPDTENRAVFLVDTSTERITRNLIHGDGRTISSCISADGCTVATLSKDGITRVFDLNISKRRVIENIDIGPRGSSLIFGSDIQRIYDGFMTNSRELPTLEELIRAVKRTEGGHSVKSIRDIYCGHILFRTVLSQDGDASITNILTDTEEIRQLLWKFMYEKTLRSDEKKIQHRAVARMVMNNAFGHKMISEEHFNLIKSTLKPLPMETTRFLDVRPFIRSLNDDLELGMTKVGKELEKVKVHEVENGENRFKDLASCLIPYFAGTYHVHLPPSGPVLLSMDVKSIMSFISENFWIPANSGDSERGSGNFDVIFIKVLISEKYAHKITSEKGRKFKRELRNKIMEVFSSFLNFETELDKIS